MPCSASLAAMVAPLALLAIGVIAPAGASAQQAGGDDRCTGTFCDWYYGGPPPEEKPGAPKPAPTPLMVPGSGTLGRIFTGGNAAQSSGQGGSGVPAKRPLVAVGGGGILGMVRGEPQDRCTGTFCDFYYGGPPPEKPSAPVEAQPGNALAPEQAADQDAAPDPVADPPAREIVERPEPQRCAAKGADPWSCYR